MLMRKVHGHQLASVHLTSGEYFVLDLMVQNMEDRQMEQVTITITTITLVIAISNSIIY